MFSQQTCRSSVNGQPSAKIEYVYDGNGNRYSKKITKADGTSTKRFYSYDTSGNIVSEYEQLTTNNQQRALVRYVRDNSGKAISMIQQPSSNNQQLVYYFTYNGHGDVTALTDQSGTVVATYSYDEFGNITSSTGTVYNPLRYSGANNAYYDTETGLYKMGTRYYQSDVGRWLTRDLLKDNDAKVELQGLNKYVYVENNPMVNIDPSGNKKNNTGSTWTKFLLKIKLNDHPKMWDIQRVGLKHNITYAAGKVKSQSSSIGSWGRKSYNFAPGINTPNLWYHKVLYKSSTTTTQANGAISASSGYAKIHAYPPSDTKLPHFENEYLITNSFDARNKTSHQGFFINGSNSYNDPVFPSWQFELEAWQKSKGKPKVRMFSIKKPAKNMINSGWSN